ncbi:MAG: bifunctional DNA-binding transcriptional regulator/O6-methylguanine-DNA methyltransferase Ada [Ktedonobacteraceae bacterium]|nr:bifunctional DNA-binding transcriptional regulator/O6-methylguanine-DNA methyltransferase Ada [Ktedonobacteraceae bacterium]
MGEEERWQAVINRDESANGKFVYAVRSTGIYCSPSCPSRKPAREQVIFFLHATDAQQAGFRPCRRCQPDKEKTVGPHIELVRRACHYIETHAEESLPLAKLGQVVNMSPYHLQRTFRQVTGITPRQYVEACRIKQLKERLKEGEMVTTAMYSVGYNSSSRFYEGAPTRLGMTPTIYRQGGQGMKIRYAITDCPLGRLLVGMTEKGICAVSLGDADEPLEAALRAEYPAAEIWRDDDMCEWVRSIVRYLQGQQPHLELPLDVQATAFEWRVWTELQAIPYGETRSYGEIAQALGDRKKARAVAHACATNPVALIVPCHRVVREDGGIGNYRWGVERKQQLLRQEQQTSAQKAEEPM